MLLALVACEEESSNPLPDAFEEADLADTPDVVVEPERSGCRNWQNWNCGAETGTSCSALCGQNLVTCIQDFDADGQCVVEHGGTAGELCAAAPHEPSGCEICEAAIYGCLEAAIIE